jgi:hypothetical protein
MIQLTFDTDVWLNLLKIGYHDSDRFEEILQILYVDELTILLPENIRKEFERGIERKRGSILTEIKNITKLVSPINQNNKKIEELKNADWVDSVLAKRIVKIKELFNRKATLIPSFTDQIYITSAKRCVDCQAPNHKKDSMRDTINIFSLYFYLVCKPKGEVHFVTENYKDFSESDLKKMNLHHELVPIFGHVGMIYHFGFNNYYQQMLRPILLVDSNKHKVENSIHAKSTDTIIDDKSNNEYLKNIQIIDLALKASEPSLFLVESVFNLVLKDIGYKDYFFKNVRQAIWIEHFDKEGFFSSEPSQTNSPTIDYSNNSYYPPIFFLSKLSETFLNGENLIHIPRVIEIISDVSLNGGNNYLTWVYFIRILINIPGEKIPLSILQHISTWINESRSTPQTMDLTEKLLPKFLNDTPSKEDIEKAELVIHHLFKLEKGGLKSSNENYAEYSSYLSNVDFYWLQNGLIDSGLTKSIVKYCSFEPVCQLIGNIKSIYRDYPNGIQFQIETDVESLLFKAYVVGSELELYQVLSSEEGRDSDDNLFIHKISDFDRLNENEIVDLIKTKLYEQFSIRNPKSDNTGSSIHYSLFDDRSNVRFRTIEEIDNYRRGNDNKLDCYIAILKFLLTDGIEIKTNEYHNIVVQLAVNPEYNLPLLRRFAIHFFGKFWSLFKDDFFSIIGTDDSYNFFSDYRFENDLRTLLNRNAKKLTTSERNKIHQIIISGPHETNATKQNHKDYWKLKWLSALNELDEFKTEYSILSDKLQLDREHFESHGKIQYRSGFISPFSVDELLSMTNREIAEQIAGFQPKKGWNDPETNGFAENLRLAIVVSPSKFTDNLNEFKNIPYLYAYNLYRGFREAWEKDKVFNWSNLFDFTEEYISNTNFGNPQLKLEDDNLGSDHKWIVGSIANLIKEGTRDDSHAFDKRLLAKSKRIIFMLFQHIGNTDDYESSNMNYPDYTLNSTEGKLLHALVNQALRTARVKTGKNKTVNWSKDIKGKFEIVLKKDIVDGHVLLGMYFRQFMFLDKLWLLAKVSEILQRNDKLKYAFFDGYLFSVPVIDEEILEIIYPFYKERILKKVSSENLIRHIVTYLFWGEGNVNDSGSLTKLFISSCESQEITKMLHTIWSERENISLLKQTENDRIIKRIKLMWRLLLNFYKEPKIEKDSEVLSALPQLSFIYKNINKESYDKLILSMPFMKGSHNMYLLLEEFERLINARINAHSLEYLGKLLLALPPSNFIFDEEKKRISSLVSLLYEYKSHGEILKIGNEICNRYASSGHFFLNDLYFKHN